MPRADLHALLQDQGPGWLTQVLTYRCRADPRSRGHRVLLANGHGVLATLAGKIRRFRIRVLAGDRVMLELSPYNLDRGRITVRRKGEPAAVGSAARP